VTTLIANYTTGQGCNGGTESDLQTAIMGADVGATTITVVAGQATVSSGCGGWLTRLFKNTSPTLAGSTQIGAQQGPFSGTSGSPQTVTWTGLTIDQPYLIVWFNMNQPPCCGTWFVQSVDDNFSGTYCAGGTELQSGASFVYYLTPGLIDVWLGTLGLAWLAPFFTAFWFTTLDASNLCSALPPLTWGTITADPSQISTASLYDLLRAIAWQNVCQCSGSGTSPPAPFPGEPTGAPSLPTIACSNSDVCATITDIWQDLAQTQKRVNEIYNLLQLVQRQAVPFGYVTGTCHAGLTGAGELSVSDILGLSVSFSGGDSTIGEEAGHPTTLFQVGWINVGDAAGWRSGERIHSNPWVYLPDLAGEITKIGYSLNPLITAEICELIREP